MFRSVLIVIIQDNPRFLWLYDSNPRFYDSALAGQRQYRRQSVNVKS